MTIKGELDNKLVAELEIACHEAFTELAGKLENELTAELEDSSQQSYEELHVKLRNEPTTELNFRAKVRDKSTTELFRACCEAKAELAAKLEMSLL